VKGLAFQRIHL